MLHPTTSNILSKLEAMMDLTWATLTSLPKSDASRSLYCCRYNKYGYSKYIINYAHAAAKIRICATIRTVCLRS